ncbi:threonine/serine exporter family protein [Weissella bombi]|uniref:Uncharacterized membrane protein YjjB, DUF3815 family n=1 Tax=Weissella bombi TaxID=1505725 RepID=A0A1C4B1J4_9LACO|nr:threonine/serine exporter family protein [Weissella bombi]SCC00706.1 Uncharacterized membrane protein YjjB, DUF3815 family [Weissella bombi]
MMTLFHFIIQFVFSYLGTFTFGLFINVPKKMLNEASLLGGLGWIVYWVLFKLGGGSILGNFLGALVVGLGGIIFSIRKKAPSTIFSIPGLVPLVPGASAYQALTSFVNQQPVEALTQTIHVTMVTGAIALGYVTSQMISEIVYKKRPKKS